jgi:penicillin-binding protein 1A
MSLVAAVGVFALLGYTYTRLAQQMPELDRYAAAELAQTSVVYDAQGNVVQELHGVQNRFVVPLKDVNPSLQDAVVAIEDHRFYEHRGIDFEAIGRAAQRNLETLSIQEGGSTLTQQLVKNTYIAQEQRQVPSFQRKITEASLAWQYEKSHSKKEILEQYLNTVYFGSNAYGAQAAAKTYFNKDAEDLTIPESALLAGIINLPGAYDPFNDPETAKKRRNVVLDAMLRYGYITKKEHDEAVKTEIKLSRGRVETENDNEYFLDAVRKELAREYGDDFVYEGGLKIYTTLDPRLQKVAANSVDQIVSPENGDPSASLVSVDPATGAVKAMVGGSDFEQVKFNLATQGRRQPGSSFKTFVMAEAIRQGIDPETTRYVSKDLRIPLPEGSDEPYYKVSNYANVERGPIDLNEALAQSDNTVFVQLAMDLGLKNVVDMAHKMGIKSEVDPYPATAIGGLTYGVNPLEMASAYSTLANGGEHMEPYLVQKVTREENGKEVVVEEHKPEGRRALSRDEAAVVTQALRGVVEEGTASAFHDLDSELGGRPSAGKTGTTEEFSDAWFVGYVPQLATSVWVGYPGERRSMVNINGLEEINGENYPLDIWSLYMQGATAGLPIEQFDEPSSKLDLDRKTSGRAYGSPDRSDDDRDGFDFDFGDDDGPQEEDDYTPPSDDPAIPSVQAEGPGSSDDDEPTASAAAYGEPVQQEQPAVQQQQVQQEPVYPAEEPAVEQEPVYSEPAAVSEEPVYSEEPPASSSGDNVIVLEGEAAQEFLETGVLPDQ